MYLKAKLHVYEQADTYSLLKWCCCK